MRATVGGRHAGPKEVTGILGDCVRDQFSFFEISRMEIRPDVGIVPPPFIPGIYPLLEHCDMVWAGHSLALHSVTLHACTHLEPVRVYLPLLESSRVGYLSFSKSSELDARLSIVRTDSHLEEHAECAISRSERSILVFRA